VRADKEPRDAAVADDDAGRRKEKRARTKSESSDTPPSSDPSLCEGEVSGDEMSACSSERASVEAGLSLISVWGERASCETTSSTAAAPCCCSCRADAWEWTDDEGGDEDGREDGEEDEEDVD